MSAQPQRNVITNALAQIGEAGLFLLTLLAAVPRSMKHARETVRKKGGKGKGSSEGRREGGGGREWAWARGRE